MTLPAPPSLEELKTASLTILEQFEDKGDRQTVIIAVAYLDDALGKLLEAFFVDDKDGVRALPKSLWARCSLAYAVGLISPLMLKDMGDLKDVRNRFAHQWQHLRFWTDDIAEKCRNLHHGQLASGGTSEDPRQRFVGTVALLVSHLIREAEKVKHRPQKGEFHWKASDFPGSCLVAGD